MPDKPTTAAGYDPDYVSLVHASTFSSSRPCRMIEAATFATSSRTSPLSLHQGYT